MYRDIKKSYHIDYIFASKEIVKNGFKLSLGKPEEWIDKSDHIPLILDIYDFSSKIKTQNNLFDFTNRHLTFLDDFTKSKFENEIKTIENLAKKIDSDNYTENEKMTLVDKIETLKTIDKLIIRLKK